MVFAPAAANAATVGTSSSSLLRSLLQNPSAIRSKLGAQQLHAQLLKAPRTPSSALDHHAVVLSVYANLGLARDAALAFAYLPYRSTLCWKAIIRCSTAHGLFVQSVSLFLRMRREANSAAGQQHVLPSVLKACTMLGNLRLGESIHGYAVRLGLGLDLYVGNALMNMYCKLHESEGKLFDGMPHRDSLRREEMVMRRMDFTERL
ncbi:hypothetical protein Taro_018894 [Colocasia esculenta]|uniref:Pentatricopeptide repeat-containing protein n=1 Tax=Colocasia esculenta TaxID=4460 RepID=A0A843USJ3_COLES|nr:hypothetical protein [Colocasia esculenta]